MSLRLIKPTLELEQEYRTMLAEWHATGEDLVPFVLGYDISDFSVFINRFKDDEAGINQPPNWVPHTSFWLVNETNTILGVISIRHQLNEFLQQYGGHIGYGIRPSERKKGYATELLRLALLEAKQLGIDQVLVTTKKWNKASQQVILKNGGVYSQANTLDGEEVLSYWITIN